MKKNTFERKLTLKKETLANLDNRQMIAVHGGAGMETRYFTCGKCGTNGDKTCNCPILQTLVNTCPDC